MFIEEPKMSQKDYKKRLEAYKQFLADLEEIKLKYEDGPGGLFFEVYKHFKPSLTFEFGLKFDNFNDLIEKMRYFYKGNSPSGKICFGYRVNLKEQKRYVKKRWFFLTFEVLAEEEKEYFAYCDLDKRFLYNCNIEKIDGKLIIKSEKN